MTQISNTPHVFTLVSDYVLELLPGDESERVAIHLSTCPQCRQAVNVEREIGRTVRDTLKAASLPDRHRLRQIMPPPPVNSAASRSLATFAPAWAITGLLLIVACSAMLLYFNQRPSGWGVAPPTTWSTAVTLTDTPTQTATREIAATVVQDASLQPLTAPVAADHNASPMPELAPVPSAPLSR